MPYTKYFVLRAVTEILNELRIWYWGDRTNLFNQVQEWTYIEEL